jgi:hypothetical protein
MGHLKDIDETYFEHFRHAFEIGSVLLLSSFAQIFHSIVPDFHPPFGSDVDSLIKFLESKKAMNRHDKKTNHNKE